MIELIEGLPAGVVGFEAVGKVSADDYDGVAPAIEQALTRREKIRLIHVLGARFTGYTRGGMWRDAKLGLSHPFSFDRIAVVTDDESVQAQVKHGGWVVPGEIKLFSNTERAQAEAWVSADLEEKP
jgi:hypothetical protein